MDWKKAKGTRVYSRDGKEVGVVSGDFKDCGMENCPGTRIKVNWPNGNYTWPCSCGLERYQDGWKIMWVKQFKGKT